MERFKRDLDECRRKAALSNSDLSLWFGVPRTSIHNWLHKGMKPQPYKREHLEHRLALLTQTINRKNSPFPVPHFTSQYNRRSYILGALNAALGDRVP